MTNADKIDSLFKELTQDNIKNLIDPLTINLIGSETIGELLEKLQILNIRIWVLEDMAAVAKSEKKDDVYILLKNKLDVCFKIKRPKLILAINQMLDSLLLGNDSHTKDGQYKIYKNEDQ